MRISELYIYPVKSCGGIQVRKLDLTPSGPRWDRTIVLVDDSGKFISQRTHPRMCTIGTSLMPLPNGNAILTVTAQTMHPKDILLENDSKLEGADLRESVTIHKDTCAGLDLGPDVSDWFSNFLGIRCSAVRQMSWSPRVRQPSSLNHPIQVSYADAYPLLVTSEASLRDLNERITRAGNVAVSMVRFRPNIVVTDCEPYAEDSWKKFRVGNGGALIEGANKCVRCIVTTTDQRSGIRGKEPLWTLSTYRKSEEGGVEFGRNFVIANPGKIAVGDKLKAVD